MFISWPFLAVRTQTETIPQRRPARRGRVARLLPRLENLEDRVVPAFMAPVDIAAGLAITSSAVADFNGDGFKDIVVSGSISGRGVVEVLLNNQNGTFTPQPMYNTGNTPIEVKVGDFDGDGHKDVVTLASYYTGALTVLKGNGDGTFQPYTPYTVLTPPTEVEVQDVNGDGHDDLVAGNHYFNTMSVYLSNATGLLSTRLDFAGGGSPASVALGDINGDGKMDLVSANQLSAGTLSVQLGTGTGSFLAQTSFPAGSGPLSVTLGDFNGDGKLDAAVANSYIPNTISVMLGNGDGTFQSPVSYNSGSSPLDISKGDVNGDGKLDLIERTGAGFSVELGNGDGTFGAAISIPAGAGNSLQLADFNNDGGLDVVKTTSAGVVSVMMNDNSGLTGIITTTNLALSSPATTGAGADVPVTVTALDTAGILKGDFLGTVTLLSSDVRGTTVSYTFTTADAGVHTFATGLKLYTVGAQSITATATLVGTASQSIAVTTGAAAKLGISTATSTAAAGADTIIRLAALDAFGNMGAAYTGTVHFGSNDVQAGLPADYTFTPADGGIHSFTVNLKTAANDYITATDTVNLSLSGSSSNIFVTPLAASSLRVAGGAGSIGVLRPVGVRASDIYGNTATGFNGIVHFSSTDPATILPADAALSFGSGTFYIKLLNEGAQTISVSAVADSTVTGSEVIDGTTAALGSYVISGLPATVAGTAQTFTVRAFDVLGKAATKYNGTVSFYSSDYQAGLPLSYTFTAADAGVHTFTATLKTAGSQSITARDTLVGVLGSQTGIAVKAAAATSLSVSGPTSAVAGVAIPLTVMVRDPYGNLATDYTGKVKFTSNDLIAGLPAVYTFNAADAGVHTFNVILKLANTKTTLTSVTVADTSNIAMTATLGGIDVVNGVAAQIVLTPPSGITVGTAFSLKVTVLDAFGNRVKNYTGTLHFSDSVAATGLPADYTFNAADAGVHTFSVILSAAVTQTLTVIDTSALALVGTASVTPKAAGGGGGGGGGGGRI